MNLNKLGRGVQGFNDELKFARAFDGVGIKPPPKPQTPKPQLLPSKPPKPSIPIPQPKPQASAPTRNVSIRNERDVHNGNKTFVIGGIIAAGVAYTMLS